MTIHFIGAGPGAPDLITLRARDLIARCPVCLYAGSIIPQEILAHTAADAVRLNTAGMTLDAIIDAMQKAHERGQDVARLHSGDLAIYSAVAEQLRRLRVLGIPYQLTPGVPAFSAAAAVLGLELTLPEVAQTLVLTRTQGRASAMPPGETLEAYAATGATLAIHLSLHAIGEVLKRLSPFYGGDCPVAIVFRATHPDEQILRGRLHDIAAQVDSIPEKRSALILVGRALGESGFRDSALYDLRHQRLFRAD
ncbi:precorrin-4 C(11)-methyltransferase [Allohahella sp. A8]|uniref:precorrin-4 C(11)-methyltransferase n=1 Tax=Allohahella sp. A8 TaxID=3141461 RepID=UPI003A7FB4C7